MALNSPGVEVSLINNTAYPQVDAGTVPLIILATAENKLNAAGTGTAIATAKVNAGKLVLSSTRQELAELYGDASFTVDSMGNPVHASETSEYGLQAAYSYAGVAGSTYTLRADIDLNSLIPAANEPVGSPNDGTFWLNPKDSRFGLYEWKSNKMTPKTVEYIENEDLIEGVIGSRRPKDFYGARGSYAVITDEINNTTVLKFYWKCDFKSYNFWYRIGGDSWVDRVGGYYPIISTDASVSSTTDIRVNDVTASPNISVFIKYTNGTVAVVKYEYTMKTGANAVNLYSDFFDGLNALSIPYGVKFYLGTDNTFEIYATRTTDSANLRVKSVGIYKDSSDDDLLKSIKLEEGEYFASVYEVSPHFSVPTFGNGLSVWFNTSMSNGGTIISSKIYDEIASRWINKNCQLSESSEGLFGYSSSFAGGLYYPYNDLALVLDNTQQSAIFKLQRCGSQSGSTTKVILGNYEIDPQLAFYIMGSRGSTMVKSNVVYTGKTTVTLGKPVNSAAKTKICMSVKKPNENDYTDYTIFINNDSAPLSPLDNAKVKNILENSLPANIGLSISTNDNNCIITDDRSGSSIKFSGDTSVSLLSPEIFSDNVNDTVTRTITITKTSTDENVNLPLLNTSSLQSWVNSINTALSGKNVTCSIVGMTDRYLKFTANNTNITKLEYKYTTSSGEKSIASDAYVSSIDTLYSSQSSVIEPVATDILINRISAALTPTTIVNDISASRVGSTVLLEHKNGGNIVFININNINIDVALGGITGIENTSVTNYLTGVMASKFNNLLATSDRNTTPLFVTTNTPHTDTGTGTIWYNSLLYEVDIMVNDGGKWVGFLNKFKTANKTGPIVSATRPTSHTDGTALVAGDLWIDTSDIENYPLLKKYDPTYTGKWVPISTSDNSSSNGIIFADARWGTSGSASTPGSIVDLLQSDYVDFDAPIASQYPSGILLWNTRRSGFNVKQYKHNYINTDDENQNMGEPQSDYYPHRWVTISANQVDGSGSFGRKAQRAVVVKALQAAINSNDVLRDVESNRFDIIACPGYPELINEMLNLNSDRGNRSLVIGDAPARLDVTNTGLRNWANNVLNAVEDGEKGLVTHNEYLAVYTLWGMTSDNAGNNVVVPPSHAMLYTIANSDRIGAPWFAPAGPRRGLIINATSVGVVTKEGEFQTVALNEAKRDILYQANVNPVTYMDGTGLVCMGQKTRASYASAMDRVNVVRLEIIIREVLQRVARQFIFEQNDSYTQQSLKSSIENVLRTFVSSRAISDFLVVCDSSNNTKARIARNELWADVAILPLRSSEFIYIPMRLDDNIGA